ncbi:MAG: cytochrome c-type biogenesis protein [Myxococcota bacterium]
MMLALLITMSVAQAPAEPQPTEMVPAKIEVEVERTNDRAIILGRKIRCPVCQGMPISESPSKSAQDMMAVLRRLIAENKTDTEIIDYFKARYGEWAILEPSRSGFNLLVWLLPVVALLIAGIVFRSSIARKTEPTPEPAADDDTDDPYLRALRDEVEA